MCSLAFFHHLVRERASFQSVLIDPESKSRRYFHKVKDIIKQLPAQNPSSAQTLMTNQTTAPDQHNGLSRLTSFN